MYDIFVKAVGATHTKVSDTITKQIRKTERIISATTLSIIPERVANKNSGSSLAACDLDYAYLVYCHKAVVSDYFLDLR